MAESEKQTQLVMTRVGGGRSAGVMMVAFVLLVGGGWLLLALNPPAGAPAPSPAAVATSAATEEVATAPPTMRRPPPTAPPEVSDDDVEEVYGYAVLDGTSSLAAAASFGDRTYLLFLRQTSTAGGAYRGLARLVLPLESGSGSIELLHFSARDGASSWYSVGSWPVLLRPATAHAGRALFTAGRPPREEEGSPAIVSGGFWITASVSPDGGVMVLTVDVISPWAPRGDDFDECDWSVPVWELRC